MNNLTYHARETELRAGSYGRSNMSTSRRKIWDLDVLYLVDLGFVRACEPRSKVSSPAMAVRRWPAGSEKAGEVGGEDYGRSKIDVGRSSCLRVCDALYLAMTTA